MAHRLADPYQELGVSPSATRDEITAAFRARAKALHPDARPDDIEAAERFKRLSAAYRTLSDPQSRARYDLANAARPTAVPPQVVGTSGAPAPVRAAAPVRPRPRLSRRGARWAVVGGSVLMVLGLFAGGFVVSLQRHDSSLRANGVATTATVVSVDGARKLRFTTADGRVVTAVESVKSGEEQPAVGTKVPIHYSRTDPTNISTDESHLARDITLWVVAVKFLVGGAVLVWFGSRRLRRRTESLA